MLRQTPLWFRCFGRVWDWNSGTQDCYNVCFASWTLWTVHSAQSQTNLVTTVCRFSHRIWDGLIWKNPCLGTKWQLLLHLRDNKFSMSQKFIMKYMNLWEEKRTLSIIRQEKRTASLTILEKKDNPLTISKKKERQTWNLWEGKTVNLKILKKKGRPA